MDSIDEKKLIENTNRAPIQKLEEIPPEGIRHLHIIGYDKYDEVLYLKETGIIQPGCYYDDTMSWILLIGASKWVIRNIISLCTANLEVLTVRFTRFEQLNVSHLTGLKELDTADNRYLNHVEGLDQLHDLHKLNLSDGSMGPVLDMNGYPDLESVILSRSKINTVVLDRPLEQMRFFRANGTMIQDTHFLTYFPCLEHLSMSHTSVTALPQLEQFPELKYLCLFNSNLQSLPQIGGLSHLEELRLGGTNISSLNDIVFPAQLREIWLDHTKIRRLPDSLGQLRNLQRLNLSGLTMDELPDWLPDLGLLISNKFSSGVFLSNTKIQGVDMSIFDQPQEVILKWFEERKKANAGAPLNEVKVVFLGDGEAGKSHTIARLLKDGGTLNPGEFAGASTPGIVITDKSYDIGDRHVQVHFWDFGGQEILHSMHRMFLTERTLYVILINARDDTQDDRARYWLHNVKSFANGAPVLLVLNKMDQNPNASVNESDLRAIYPGLTEVVKLSAMFDDQEKFNANFTEAMKRQIGRMENLAFFFPAAWTKAKQRLLGMTENYIRGSDYAAICDESGVTDEGDLRRSLLNWFNDLGVSICYGGNVHLKDYVILRPNWITNAIYAILFNMHPDTKNGIISHEAIFEMIQPPKDGADPYRRTNSEETYTQQEIDYILGVTRKFRLSFRVDDGSEEEREFIPMLCQRESKPIAAKYAADPDTLEFHMTFDYLPSNVLHRLMVDLRQDLDTTQVWRTGARFAQKSSGLSAVVKSEGNVLKFFVRRNDDFHQARTYLCILKDIVDQIVRDMNLEPPVNEVVYKLDGKTERYSYDQLIAMQRCGETEIFSVAHMRRLKIDDILNQTGRKPEEEREQLFENILSICQQMQANRYYWDVKEDIRNTYVRDSLRNMGYEVADQTFSGVSGSGKGAGELDLEIRRGPNKPWTIYEALNIKNKSRKDWNFHLQKLLDNYNPNGLPFLFLVSYVEGGADQFSAVWGEFSEHIRRHSPDKYELRSHYPCPVTFGGDSQIHYIQAAKCTYDRAGFPTTVYHIFVCMGT